VEARKDVLVTHPAALEEAVEVTARTWGGRLVLHASSSARTPISWPPWWTWIRRAKAVNLRPGS